MPHIDLNPILARRYEALVNLELVLDAELCDRHRAGEEIAGEMADLMERKAALTAESKALLERIQNTPASSYEGLEAKLRLALTPDDIEDLEKNGGVLDLMPVHVLRDLGRLVRERPSCAA